MLLAFLRVWRRGAAWTGLHVMSARLCRWASCRLRCALAGRRHGHQQTGVSLVNCQRKAGGEGLCFPLPGADPGFLLYVSSPGELTVETAKWTQVVGFLWGV